MPAVCALEQSISKIGDEKNIRTWLISALLRFDLDLEKECPSGAPANNVDAVFFVRDG